MRSILHAIIAALLLLGAVPAAAQSNYPERNIRLLFGFPPGADSDERLLADKLAEAFGKAVIVENVTGAGGNIAADRIAKARPDGYTIGLLANTNIVVNVSLYGKLSYDPVKDLAPITQFFGFPNVLVINNEVPAKSVKELVELARAQPGKLTFGHSGPGTPTHLSGELVKSMARIDLQQVSYRGPPQTLTDLIGGQITMSFVAPGPALPLIREGKIRALAVTSLKRAPFALSIPTMDESGFPGFDITSWIGLFAPAGTPASIIEKLNRETTRIVALPEIRQKLYDLGHIPLGNTPAEFADVIKVETPYWARIIKDAGIKPIE
jgi:tripartite-type tricarboxylate transporter receptor subunit TctC